VSARQLDVLVLGGGPVGLAFALLLAQSLPARSDTGPRIGVLEQRPPTAPAGDIGLRVVAVSPASRNILENCGAWAALDPARYFACERMNVWEAGGAPGGARSIGFDAAELGVPALSWIVENEALRHALWARLASHPAIVTLNGRPEALERRAGALALTLEQGDLLHARLAVGADGADSWLRRALDVPVSGRGYAQRALVTHVVAERPHRGTAWQRFAPGGPLALLPLDARRCSVVWSRPEAEAGELLAADDATLAAALTRASDGVLGHLAIVAPRAAFPLAMNHARNYTGARFALIGDAAHQVHPLAGQGINLGLLDAAALAEVLASHLQQAAADPGDRACLRRYERWRKGDNLLTLGAMDLLHRLFAGEHQGLGALAGTGMRLVGRVPSLKAVLARAAMGSAADLPRAARGAIMQHMAD
jgi:ubiquinone biosynthesis UbiH/UbiF/VisC/COQ6 family hydroxylase